jgi:hypothetical protein
MSGNHDGKLGLALQIELLEISLAESHKSWKFCRLPADSNSVAESISRDIAEKRLQLAAE